MGVFQPEISHESQTSSVSYDLGLRWKQLNWRVLSVTGVLSIAIALLILLYVDLQSSKQITLVIDGKAQTLETRESLLGDLLSKEQIPLQPHDKISMAMDGSLSDGDRIAIVRARSISITVDGKTEQLHTTENTVGEAINKLGYSLKGHDKIFPSLHTPITAGMEVKIVRINKQVVQRTKSLPFRVIKTADPTLLKGKTKVTQAGVPGVMIQHIEKVYQDGELASMRMIGKEVKTATKDKVIAVGTKPLPKPVVVKAAAATQAKAKATATKAKSSKTVRKAGVDFEYKRMIKNVSMTAYSSQEPGIGTRTASGTRVTEGRTIAVDPKVIPIGWWVYIEGLGFRRAEDTGGAIKGNKIDVYYDSLSHAVNFGRKSRTVYVIGPSKPELN